jgi:hypothetical protein
MFNFDRFDIQRAAVAAVGALFLSTTFIVATVAPMDAAQASVQASVPAVR